MVDKLFEGMKYQYLLQQLILRDIKVRYRRSVLGLLWTVLNPLLMMGIMTFVFSHLFSIDIENYPVYFLSGNILFGFFSEATTQALWAIIGNNALIKKIYIPQYLFPLSRVMSSLVNLFFSLIALLIVMVITGAEFHWTILFLWVAIFFLFLFAIGVGLVLSAYTVFYRDIAHLYGVLILAWTYMTPLFYPIDIIPLEYRWVMGLNPMYRFIDFFRMLIINGSIPSYIDILVIMCLGVGVFIVGFKVFYNKQKKFILYL